MKNVLEFKTHKLKNQKMTMLTCYDYAFAKLIQDSEIDTVLVGDSVAQVIHGHDNTLTATTAMIALHTKAVRRGTDKFIVADMPFLSTRKGLKYAMDCVQHLMTSGANAIKIEGCKGHTELIKHIVDSGIPVMGHLGLTPQSIHQLGGPKIQGRSQLQAEEIFNEAKLLQAAGCFALVLECVPAQLAKKLTGELTIPTIGIGAGADCDGQVLVLQDMLGMNTAFNPKFLKKYSDLGSEIKKALNNYVTEVKNSQFPKIENSYE